MVYFGIPITFRESKWRSYRVTFQAIGSHAGEGSPCKGFGWVTFSSPEEAEVRCCKSLDVEKVMQKIRTLEILREFSQAGDFYSGT